MSNLERELQIITKDEKEPPFKVVDRRKVSEEERKLSEKLLRKLNRQKEYGAEEDIFDPEIELEKVRHAPRAEKPELIEEYKENLAEQMAGVAKINSELENIILNTPATKEDLANYLAEQAKIYKLSPKQLEKYNFIFDKVEQEKKTIDLIVDQIDGKDGKDAFKTLFGFAPVGEVEIQKSPISFFVICGDLRDYSRLYAGGDNPEQIEKARSTGGFSRRGKFCLEDQGGVVVLDYKLTVANKTGFDGQERSEDEIEKTRIHEEKHALNKIVREIENDGRFIPLASEEAEKQRNSFIEKLNQFRIHNELRAKDEILSYLKDGSDVYGVGINLLEKKSEGGTYDYFESDKEFLSSQYPEIKNELIDNIFDHIKMKYAVNILLAVETVGKLQQLDFSKERIIGLFQVEPLERWGKVFERFKKSDEFKKRKDEAIKYWDIAIVKFRDAIDGYREALEKERKNLGFGKMLNLIFIKFRNIFKDKKEKTREQVLVRGVERAQKDYDDAIKNKAECEGI